MCLSPSVDVSVLHDIVGYLEQHREVVELKEPNDSECDCVSAQTFCITCGSVCRITIMQNFSPYSFSSPLLSCSASPSPPLPSPATLPSLSPPLSFPLTLFPSLSPLLPLPLPCLPLFPSLLCTKVYFFPAAMSAARYANDVELAQRIKHLAQKDNWLLVQNVEFFL